MDTKTREKYEYLLFNCELPYKLTSDWRYGTDNSRDGFGIRKLYPSYRYSTGRYSVWHCNMSNIEDDIHNLNSFRASRNSDGSWMISDQDSSHRVRMEAPSPNNAHFLNFEMTAYYRLEYSDENRNSGFVFQPYGRGGHHSPSTWINRCDGSAYKGSIVINPKAQSGGGLSAIRKEINHGAYCPNRYGTGTGTASYSSSFSKARYWTKKSLYYRWLGVKLVVFNYRTGSGLKAVHIGLWVDNSAPSSTSNVKNVVGGSASRWVRIQQTNDYGGWSTSSAYFYTKCPWMNDNVGRGYRQRDEIFTEHGDNRYYRDAPENNYATWRSDYSRYRMAFLSCREIAPRNAVR